MSAGTGEGQEVPQQRPPSLWRPGRRDEPMPSWIPAAALWLVGATAGVAGLLAVVSRVRDLLVSVLISLFLSFAMEPAVNRLAARGWRRGVAVWLVFSVATAAFAALCIGVGAVGINEGAKLVEDLPATTEAVAEWVSDRTGIDIDASSLTEPGGPLDRFAETASDKILSVSGQALAVVGRLLTIAFFTFYLTVDAPRLRRTVCSLVRPDRQREVLRVWEIAVEKTGGYLYVRVVLAAVSAAVSAVVFLAMGVNYAIPLALWVGVISQLIPVLGAYLAAALPIMVALVASPGRAVAVTAFIIIYQQLENHFLSPKLTRRTVNLHPAVGLASVLTGAALLGAPGALLAVPAAATIQAFVSSYVHRHEVIDSELVEEQPPRRRNGDCP